MAITEETAKRVLERWNYKCGVCGLRAQYGNKLEIHHCLVHRSKNNPRLDEEYNLQPVHAKGCHQRANSRKHREEFWTKQIAHHGQAMRDWYEGLPLKSKEKF